MAASDPADAVQVALFQLLSGDATLSGMVTGVFDQAPEDALLDYVQIGDVVSSPDGEHGTEGRQLAVTVTTWTRAESFALCNTIGARVAALLWHRHVELDALVVGHRVWRVEHEFSQTLRDPEPHVRRRVDRFRIHTLQGDW